MRNSTSTFEEKDLIAQASNGDLDAFNQLVLQYQDAVYHHAYTWRPCTGRRCDSGEL